MHFFTGQNMKMEPTPWWTEKHLVNMERLYCELALEKLENKFMGQNGRPLKNYKELFPFDFRQDKQTSEAEIVDAPDHGDSSGCNPETIVENRPENETEPEGKQVGHVGVCPCCKNLFCWSRNAQVWREREERTGTVVTSAQDEAQPGTSTGETGAQIKTATELLTLENLGRGRKRASVRKKPGNKVLIKGDPGMGMTTLAKKIAWDWATKNFTRFTAVFFVDLKHVAGKEAVVVDGKTIERPLTIERAIMQQNSFIEGLDITEDKLRKMLHAFSSQCLLILDGLDEHGPHMNTDALEVIEGRRLLQCSLLVISTPHIAKDYEEWFYSVVSVKGFSEQVAKDFALSVLGDEKKADSVIHTGPANSKQKDQPFVSPLQLSFRCALARSADLLNESLETGETINRLIRDRYRKYMIQKREAFQEDNLLAMLRLVGKLAWQTLLSGNSMMKRSDVEKEVGEGAFGCGLLIEHQAFNAIEVFVKFTHRTIQEFLAAFYLVLMLSEGMPIESLLCDDQQPIFLYNVVFLEFCLWFVSCKQMFFQDTVLAYEAIISNTANWVNKFHCVVENHPALAQMNSENKSCELFLQ